MKNQDDDVEANASPKASSNVRQLKPHGQQLPAAAAARGTNGTDQVLERLVKGGTKSNCTGPLQKPGTPSLTPANFVPEPYLLAANGVWYGEKGETQILICSPMIIYALTKGVDGRDYGLVVVAENLSGDIVRHTIPAAHLHGDPKEFARVLADKGIHITPGRERKLADYLDASRILATKGTWLTASPKLGWLPGEKLAFLYPDESYGCSTTVYQPPNPSRITERLAARGALYDWQMTVANLAVSDKTCRFVLAAALAAPLLPFANSDSFGFHFFGLTSRGKTTLMQVAASVFGNGSDPNTDHGALARKWDFTAKASESIAEEHNNFVLPLDELGSFRSADQLGNIIYNLCSGQGMQRLNANADPRPTREWSTLLMSSGEIDIRELMGHHGNNQKGGQAIRMLDLPLPEDGIFAGEPNPRQLVDELKAECRKYYGTAGREFIQWLIRTYQTKSDLSELVLYRVAEFAAFLADGCPPEVARAAGRFALVYVAGEMAIRAGILNCELEQIEQSVWHMWNSWRKAVPIVDDGERAISAITTFIKANLGRFPSDSDTQAITQEIYGYVTAKGLYLFNDIGMKKALGDISHRAAMTALEKRGLLFKNDRGRHKSKHTVASLSARSNFYAIQRAILEYDPEQVSHASARQSQAPVLPEVLAPASAVTAVPHVPEEEDII